MNVQCILSRPEYKDTSYGTGIWKSGEIKRVADEIGMKMLKHKDVYGEPSKAVNDDEIQEVQLASETKTPLEESNDLILQEIGTMNKAQLYDFVVKNFNIKPDLRSYRTEQMIRDYALQLFHQFGVPQRT